MLSSDDMSTFPYNRGIAQTTSNLSIPPRLSHLPPSLTTERPSMVEFNAAIQAQQIHSTDGYNMEQEQHQGLYDQYSSSSTMFNQNVATRQTTGIYPPNPAFSLHTQIYTPSERLLPYAGDLPPRTDIPPFSNYRNNFFHQPVNTNFGQGYPQIGTNERQDMCLPPREAGRNLHLGGLAKQSGMK